MRDHTQRLFGVRYRRLRCPRCRVCRHFTFYAPHRMVCTRGHVYEMNHEFTKVLRAA